MKNLKVYGNEKELMRLIEFSKKENRKTSITEKMIANTSGFFSASGNTIRDKAIYGLRFVAGCFNFAASATLYTLDRASKKGKLASIMNCSKKEIAYSEGDFAYKDGSPKTTIIGCANDLSVTKSIRSESLKELKVITKDFHIESVTEENYGQLNSLEFVGGNLYLSDNNVEAYETNQLLPNLKHIGGKVLVNAKEYRKR